MVLSQIWGCFLNFHAISVLKMRQNRPTPWNFWGYSIELWQNCGFDTDLTWGFELCHWTLPRSWGYLWKISKWKASREGTCRINPCQIMLIDHVIYTLCITARPLIFTCYDIVTTPLLSGMHTPIATTETVDAHSEWLKTDDPLVHIYLCIYIYIYIYIVHIYYIHIYYIHIYYIHIYYRITYIYI